MQTKYIECCCSSSEHVLRFISDPDDNEIYAEVQLREHQNIYMRIWIAVKYIFRGRLIWIF